MADTKTLTLSEFLLARIAEDEAAARAAGGAHWLVREVPYQGVWFVGTDADYLPPDASESYETEHAERHDPARVLAEVDAKRRIVENLHALAAKTDDGENWTPADSALIDTLRILSLPYAEHPDYREEWRV